MEEAIYPSISPHCHKNKIISSIFHAIGFIHFNGDSAIANSKQHNTTEISRKCGALEIATGLLARKTRTS